MRDRTGITTMSDGIARRSPLESGPVGEAKQSFDGFIRDTWGGYASRLVEYWGEHDVDLTFEDACVILGITPEIVRAESERQFQNDIESTTYIGYIKTRKNQWRKEAEAQYEPYRDELHGMVDAIAEKYAVPDRAGADQEADIIQEQITTLDHSEELRSISRTLSELHREAERLDPNAAPKEVRDEARSKFDEVADRMTELQQRYYYLQGQIDLLCAKRDALLSGTVLTLEDFIVELYSTDLSNNPLSILWGAALRPCVDEILGDIGLNYPEKIHATEVYVGEQAFELFKQLISTNGIVWAQVEQKMNFIRPAFYTSTTIDNHPLFTGIGEK